MSEPNFEAQIKATLDIGDAQKTFEFFKSSIQNTPIKVKLDSDFVGSNSNFLKSIQKQFQSAGQSAGESLQQGVQRGLKSYKFNGNIEDFTKNQITSLNRVKKNAKQVEEQVSKTLNNSTPGEVKSVSNSIAKKYETASNQYIKQAEQNVEKLKTIRKKESALYDNPYRDAYQSIGNKSSTLQDMKSYYEELEKITTLQKNAVDNGNYASTSAKMNSALSQYAKQDFESLSKAREYAKEYTQITSDLQKHYDKSNSFSLSPEQLESYANKLPTLQRQYSNAMSVVRTETSKTASELSKIQKSNDVMSYYNNNTKMQKKYGQSILGIAEGYKNATTEGEIQELTARYKELKSAISAEDLEGKSLFDEIGRGFSQIGQFVATYGIIQQIPTVISQSVSELKELNSIITEISKTSDSTASELQQLTNDSFESASKYGKKASDYLVGVQEMNRSGYYGEQGTAMAELSILGQAAGDMTAEVSNAYLLATDAAYGYQGAVDKLNAVLDGQNMINKMVMLYRNIWLHNWLLSWNTQRWAIGRIS